MIRVFDAFAGTQSTKKALTIKYKIDSWKLENEFIWVGERENKRIVEYIGADIYSPEDTNLIFDLSQEDIITKLLEQLGDWKPDFIWASPLCTTFSRAGCVPGGTLSYELDENERVVIRTNFKDITHKTYVKHINNPEFQKKHQDAGVLGLKLLNNTKKIINYFNVPFIVENPANALSKYEYTEYIRNITQYCMYGMPYKKSTAFYSNMKFDLLKCNHKFHYQVMSRNKRKEGVSNAPSGNAKRSIIPPLLIKSMLDQIFGKGEEWQKD